MLQLRWLKGKLDHGIFKLQYRDDKNLAHEWKDVPQTELPALNDRQGYLKFEDIDVPDLERRLIGIAETAKNLVLNEIEKWSKEMDRDSQIENLIERIKAL